MKYYIENTGTWRAQTPEQTLEHMFCTLGNGVDLDNKGYLSGNYRCKEAYVFGEPKPLSWIYPWSNTPDFQPFRKLAGCRDVGFKEAAKHFIECVKITPDTVENIKEWKDNLIVVSDALLNTPTIEDEYKSVEEGFDKFKEKVLDSKKSIDKIMDGTKVDEGNSVSKVWYFDVQWSDCPDFVEDEVRNMWSEYELGNDRYIVKTYLDQELFNQYPNIYFWLKLKGVQEDEFVIVHWWW